MSHRLGTLQELSESQYYSESYYYLKKSCSKMCYNDFNTRKTPQSREWGSRPKPRKGFINWLMPYYPLLALARPSFCIPNFLVFIFCATLLFSSLKVTLTKLVFLPSIILFFYGYTRKNMEGIIPNCLDFPYKAIANTTGTALVFLRNTWSEYGKGKLPRRYVLKPNYCPQW